MRKKTIEEELAEIHKETEAIVNSLQAEYKIHDMTTKEKADQNYFQDIKQQRLCNYETSFKNFVFGKTS